MKANRYRVVMYPSFTDKPYILQKRKFYIFWIDICWYYKMQDAIDSMYELNKGQH